MATGNVFTNPIDDIRKKVSNISPPNTVVINSTPVVTTTTEGKCYFVGLTTLEKLEIQFVPPDIKLNRNPNIASVQIVGKNTPSYHYLGGETTINMQLDFFANDDDRQDVLRSCKWLEALCYNDGFNEPPEKVKLVFGKMFRDEIWTVKKVSCQFQMFSKPHGYVPQQAYVDIELGLDPTFNLRWKDVKWTDKLQSQLQTQNRKAPRFI